LAGTTSLLFSDVSFTLKTTFTPRPAKCPARNKAPNLGPRYDNVLLRQDYHTLHRVVINEYAQQWNDYYEGKTEELG
jgi:hypothetical protein